jgi:hypothetical protein
VIGALLRYAAFSGSHEQAVVALEAVDARGLEAWREAVEKVARILAEPIADAAADPTAPFECRHGYTTGCPDCDVPEYLPTTLEP